MYISKIDLITVVLALSSFPLFAVVTETKASSIFGNYNPPNSEEIDQTRNSGSGSRSDCKNPIAKDSLMLLIPEEEIAHQTISSNPSFYFYAKTVPKIPLKFNLIIPEANVNNPIVKKTLIVKEPGIQKIELPSSVKLEYNKIHLWQIGISCSNNLARLNQVLRGAVKRVPISKKLALQLSVPEDSLEQAKIYAHNGIWYEALDSALQKQDDPELVHYTQSLLSNVKINLDLAPISRKNNNL